MKKQQSLIMLCILLLSMMAFYVAMPTAKALVEPGVTTNPVPLGYGFIDFEEGTDGAVIASSLPGVRFTTTQGYDWVYGDVRTGSYNARSLTDPSVNYGNYVVNGYFFAWLGPNMGQGRIDFTMGTASYFSVLASTYSGICLDAYDSAGNFLATSGWASGNLYTYTFTRLTIQTPGMAYIIVHDTGNYWEIDDLVTDAPGVPPQAVLYAGGSDPGVVYRYAGGTNWQVISPELGYAVLCLVDYEGHMYAGTMSTSDPLGGVGRVYRYDGGSNWTLVGDNLDNQVCSLAVYQGDLYAGTAWHGMKLYRYEGGTTWTQVIPNPIWDGTRSLYVSHGYLLLGDIGYDRFGRWDGSNFYADLEGGGSCIYDYQDYGTCVYASAYDGRLWRSNDAISWSNVLGFYDGNMWELEEFQGLLYMSYSNGELYASDGTTRGTCVYTAPDGIISMTTDGEYLYFGTGGEAGAYYGSETSGIANVYQYDGTNVVQISLDDAMVTGVQVLYISHARPTQYYLTVVSPYDTPGGMGWYNSGTNAYATLATGIVDIVPGWMRAVFTGWSGDATGTGLTSDPITMNGNRTAIADWTIQYYLGVATDPSTLPPIPGEDWYDNCTWVRLTAPEYVPNAMGVSGVRYRFSYWDVDGTSQGAGTNPIDVHMNAPHLATAHFALQYYLTLTTSPPGVNSPTGEGWYDSGALASVSTAQYVVIVPGVSRYSFNNWTTTDITEITNPTSPSTTVLIDKAKTVTANYVIQYNPTASFTWSPPMPRATKTVTFDASTSTANTGTIVSYTWDFDDGNTTTTTSPMITHRYGNPKRYNVTLTVLNSVGLTNAITKSVKITCLADINMDGKVDIKDIAMVTAAFGSYPGHPRWNPDCDMNGDNRIDIYDVAYVAKYFGFHDP
jgi:hypothetical protein